MNITLLTFFALTLVLIDTLVLRYFSNTFLKVQATLGNSFVVSFLSIVSAAAAAAAFSRLGLDSVSLILFPLVVELIVGGLTIKLFIWRKSEENGDGIPESFMLAVFLVVGTAVGIVLLFFAGFLGSSFSQLGRSSN